MPQIVDSYSESNQDSLSVLYGGYVEDFGQTFYGDNGVLNSSKLYIKKEGSPTGYCYVKIFLSQDGSLIPSGNAIAVSDAYDVTSFTTNLQLVTFYFSGTNKITLSSTTRYIVSLEYTGGDSSNKLYIGYDGSAGTHSGRALSNDVSFGGWGVLGSNCDTCFYVYKDAIYTIVSDACSFSLSGANASIHKEYTLTTSVGSFSLSGINAVIQKLSKIYPLVCSFSLSGKTVILQKASVLNPLVSSFTLTCPSVILGKVITLTTQVANFALTGKTISFQKTNKLQTLTASFSLSGGGSSLEEITPVSPKKRFIYKAYDSVGAFISTIPDVVDDPKFTAYINGGLGDLTFKLPRSIFSYEEGTVIAQNNQIKVECFDSDDPKGTVIYNGYISKYTPTLQEGKQYVTVTCLGYISETARFMAEDASGNTTLTYNSYEPTDILKDILDKFTAQGGHADYTSTSTDDTGWTVSYEMNTYTVKEALDQVIELSPNGWYYFVDENNTVQFHGKDSTANHTFVLGKDVISIIPEKSTENMVNRIYFTGGEVTATGDNFYKKYERASSISTYGLHAEKYTDSRVTDENTADLIAQSILDKGDSPETRTTLVIRDNNTDDGRGYDIESIKPGDTCKIIGYGSRSVNEWDAAVWDSDKWDYDIGAVSSTVQQIMKVSYEPNKVTLEISSSIPDVSHRVEDIKRNLDKISTANNPSSPTT